MAHPAIPTHEADAILVHATKRISDQGLESFSFDAFVEAEAAAGVSVREHFRDERSLLRAAVARIFHAVGERTLAAVSGATDGADALNAFLRAYVQYFLEHMDEYRLTFVQRQLFGVERFAIDEPVMKEMFLPAITAPLAAVEAKLLADRGSREMPGGIHPRRLAFVGQMAAVGLLTTKGIAFRIGSALKHGDDALLHELGRALAGPITSLRQMSALNDAAVELARLRDEASFRRVVPELVTRALELSDGLLALRRDGELDRAVHPEARRAFDERISRFAPLAAEDGGGVLLAAPIRYEGDVEGVITGRRSGGREIDERDVARLDAFASMVGLTLENVRLYEDLQQQLDTRTKRLGEAQLRLAQAEKMAALGKLVAGVVHELNTPLGAVQSSQSTLVRATEKLQATVGAEGGPILGIVAQCADNVGTGVRRISEIVAQLKRFSRLDAAALEPLDVGAALRDAVAMLGHEAAAGCVVEVEIDELPRVKCWASRMNQVFLNVIRNAIQAVGEKGTVRVTAQREGADRVQVIVADDGRGIPLEDLPRVFEPGFTAKGGRVRAGLGLATAYQVVTDHGGEIRLESEVGKGTRVTIVLPIEVAAERP